VRSRSNNEYFNFKVDGKVNQVYFKTSNNLVLSSESIITAKLLPYMKLAQPISQPAKADAQFLSSIDQIQDIFTTWDSGFSRIPIKVVPVKDNHESENGVGTFFTGGVDSFYTLLKNFDEITHLIYVHGYENHEITSEIDKIAEKFNKKVIEVETNLRDFSDPIVEWGLYIGSALATIGHLLKPVIGKIFIPSSQTYCNLFPSGSHPLVDPLWSSSNLKFIHDGSEATRIDKVALIADHEKALNSLRVCWKYLESGDNCGKCEKCIRTMINLKAINALDRCQTFPNTIPLNKVIRAKAKTVNKKALILENLNYLKEQGDNRKLIWALWWVLHKPWIF